MKVTRVHRLMTELCAECIKAPADHVYVFDFDNTLGIKNYVLWLHGVVSHKGNGEPDDVLLAPGSTQLGKSKARIIIISRRNSDGMAEIAKHMRDWRIDALLLSSLDANGDTLPKGEVLKTNWGPLATQYRVLVFVDDEQSARDSVERVANDLGGLDEVQIVAVDLLEELKAQIHPTRLEYQSQLYAESLQ